MKKLMAEFGEYFGFSVSHTTRQPRPGEQEGKDYHYVTREVMMDLIQQGQFIENAEFSGNMYGTSKTAVEEVLARGRICILDIDVQGVKAVKGEGREAPTVKMAKTDAVEGRKLKRPRRRVLG